MLHELLAKATPNPHGNTVESHQQQHHYALACHKNEADRICSAMLQSTNLWLDLISADADCKPFGDKGTAIINSSDGKCVIVPTPEEKGRRKDRQGYLLAVITGCKISPAHLMHMARKQISWAGMLSHCTYHSNQDGNGSYDLCSTIKSVAVEVWKQLVTVHGFNTDHHSLRLDVQPKSYNSEVVQAIQRAAAEKSTEESIHSRTTSSQEGPVRLIYSATNARNVVSIIVFSPEQSCPYYQSTSLHRIYWGISTSHQHWNELNQKLNDNATQEVILETTNSVTGLDVAKDVISSEVPVSRAYYKLAQVFEDRDNLQMILSMHDIDSNTPNKKDTIPVDRLLSHGAGLDIGASPGGWTQVMHTMLKLQTIVSVDPGVIAQRVATMSGVHHIRNDISSEDTITHLVNHAPYSLIVCDACINVELLLDKIVGTLEGVSSLLNSSDELFAWPLCLVVTLKFPYKTNGSIDRHLDRSKQIISEFLNRIVYLGRNSIEATDVDAKYKICHLFANSIAERCVVALFNKKK
jgi:hypothetical protein